MELTGLEPLAFWMQTMGGPDRCSTVQSSANVDACPRQRLHAWVAVPHWVNGVLSVLLVHVRTPWCALCDDDGAVVAHEGHLIDCGYFQEFLGGAKNRDNAHTRRLVWDAYAENTSGRRL